ncbi:hypothetical protein [Egicoccus sp. AB-alg2]|uniref:hypothetical protein n=1 Tax=Egicoccus sp. AB-alg2 TaxID=3242693 RepID=UPI00359D8106
MRAALTAMVLTIVVTACGGTADLRGEAVTAQSDPQEALAEAVAATLDDAFAFEVWVDGLDGAPAPAEVAGLLRDARLTGTRAGDGEVAAAVEVDGTPPLFEIHAAPGRDPLVRVGLADVLGIPEGADPEAVIGPLLDAKGVTGEERAALLAGYGGDWIALEGLDDHHGRAGDAAELADAWDAAAAVVEVDVDGAARRYTVRVDLAALRAAVAAHLGSPVLGHDVPDEATGRITVEDARVTDVEVQLDADGSAAPATLRIALDQHGTATVPDPPRPVARVSVDDLAALVGTMHGRP